MSTGTIATFDPSALGADVPSVSPTQSLTTSESTRAMAEIQSALTIAAARPRDERRCIDKIANACQRPRLAEISQYSYSKGKGDISGPSIHLMTVVANLWGNIQFGFREMSQGRGESTVEAFAWDLESNTKRSLQFVVPHKIGLRGGKFKTLTDPREIYEWIANQAQRRVRSCLENVIPKDVIDEAVDQCTATMKAAADTSPEALNKMLAKFGEIGVSKEQIETRIQRRIEAITPAQIINLRRIFTSIKDGMSHASDWFESEKKEPPKGENQDSKPAGKSSAKETIKAKAEAAAKKDDPELAESTGDQSVFDALMQKVNGTTKPAELKKLKTQVEANKDIDDNQRQRLVAMVDEYLEASKIEG